MEEVERKLDIALENQAHIWRQLNWFMSATLVLLALILWRAW